jgi:hypothetical protein
MGRRIEQYKDNALRPILVSIVGSLENEGLFLDDLLEDYENTFTRAYGPIETELGTYGLESEFEDITYIIYILLENPEFTTEPIKRPKLRSYEITHVYERTARIQDTYLNTYNSYIPITKDMLMDLQSDGFYEPYDGEELSSEVLDSDWTDDYIDNIRVI